MTKEPLITSGSFCCWVMPGSSNCVMPGPDKCVMPGPDRASILTGT